MIHEQFPGAERTHTHTHTRKCYIRVWRHISRRARGTRLYSHDERGERGDDTILAYRRAVGAYRGCLPGRLSLDLTLPSKLDILTQRYV